MGEIGPGVAPQETKSGPQATWRTDGDHIVVDYPPGHEVFPDGKTVTFASFTPTDAVTNDDGERIFPNQDGITPANVHQTAEAPGGIQRLLQNFEEVAQIINQGEEAREQMLALVRQMAPQDGRDIRLESVIMGAKEELGRKHFRMPTQLRDRDFAIGGLRFPGLFGHKHVYAMVVDENGKFDYDEDEGILYRKINS